MSDVAPDEPESTASAIRAAVALRPATLQTAAPELLTVSHAARWLGLSRSTLYVALADGRIPVTPIDIGGWMRLSRRQLERWLDGPAAGAEEPPQPFTLPRTDSIYDEVFRDLAPATGESRAPTRSADTRSSSARACA